MNESEAIERYDHAGGGPSALRPIRWPDLAITTENLGRLLEGVLGARIDFARAAFGDDFSAESVDDDQLEEAWRREAIDVRYAPEGLYVRARHAVRIRLLDETGAEEAAETLEVEAEICLSFSTRRHARPFVDFMNGRLTRVADGASQVIDPFGLMIEPEAAVAWGLNGIEA